MSAICIHAASAPHQGVLWSKNSRFCILRIHDPTLDNRYSKVTHSLSTVSDRLPQHALNTRAPQRWRPDPLHDGVLQIPCDTARAKRCCALTPWGDALGVLFFSLHAMVQHWLQRTQGQWKPLHGDVMLAGWNAGLCDSGSRCDAQDHLEDASTCHPRAAQPGFGGRLFVFNACL